MRSILFVTAAIAAVLLAGCVEPTGKVGLLPDHRRDWLWERAESYRTQPPQPEYLHELDIPPQ